MYQRRWSTYHVPRRNISRSRYDISKDRDPGITSLAVSFGLRTWLTENFGVAISEACLIMLFIQ